MALDDNSVRSHAAAVRRARALPAVAWAAVQEPLDRSKRGRDTDAAEVAAEFGIQDPLFTQQWHIVRTPLPAPSHPKRNT